MNIVLHDYWRSSASYRVRICLNLKGRSIRRASCRPWLSMVAR